jgi:hypothetical protein
MASHALWVAALVISIAIGRRYAAESLSEFGGLDGLCDDVFVNENNGPFGYGTPLPRTRLPDCCLEALGLWPL